ncbi:hypothetical protein TYRP_003681 [Tyrophagus putrescentiae]|nr:hypothetical protein TYRP_003681 [Tyrophagus putrescentiae]
MTTISRQRNSKQTKLYGQNNVVLIVYGSSIDDNGITRGGGGGQPSSKAQNTKRPEDGNHR